MLSTVKLALFAYAAFLAIGGFLGYQEKNSLPSLMGGVGCAAVAVVAAVLLPGKPKIGLSVGILAAVAAGMRPLMLLAKGGGIKLWPSGAILGTSVVVLILCIAAFATMGKESG